MGVVIANKRNLQNPNNVTTWTSGPTARNGASLPPELGVVIANKRNLQNPNKRVEVFTAIALFIYVLVKYAFYSYCSGKCLQ